MQIFVEYRTPKDQYNFFITGILLNYIVLNPDADA